jgi:hypothetical protein
MDSDRELMPPALSATFIVLSTVYAVVVATGALTIVLCLTAWAHHTSFVEYYQYVFPRFRGGAGVTRIPTFGYGAFLAYIVTATSVAVYARRWIERAWVHRRRAS